MQGTIALNPNYTEDISEQGRLMIDGIEDVQSVIEQVFNFYKDLLLNDFLREVLPLER